MTKSHPLDGLTRFPEVMAPVRNPDAHSPINWQNRIQAEVIGPDGTVKQRIDHLGNIMATYGLNQVAALIATSTSAGSALVSSAAIGTDSTNVASTNTGLSQSTAIVQRGGASFSGSHSAPHTAAYLLTFASNNPAGAAVIQEVGLFATNVATGSMVARSGLGTDSINKGASDEIRMTYQIIASTV